MSPRAWSIRRRLPTRQALLFLIAILVPCVLLVALSLRMIAQERELADKRLADERTRLADDIRQELLSRLERIKLDALSAQTTAPAPPDRPAEQRRAVALVAPVEDGRVVLPWDRNPDAEALAATLDEPRFAEAIRLGEHDELVTSQFARATAAYQRALVAARSPQQTAVAQLLFARALAKGGRSRDAHAEYRKILQAPSRVVDDQGVPVALYAARRLLGRPDAGRSDHRGILDVLRGGLTVEPSLPPAALYMLRDLAGDLAASAPDAPLRQAATDVHQAVTARSRDLEQALALQNAFPTLMPTASAPSPTSADPVWVTFGSERELWFVTLTSSLINTAPLVMAVRAEPLLSTLDVVRAASSAQGGAKLVDVRTDPNGEPLGHNFPGLSVTFPTSDAEALAREGSLQRSFYLAALLLVLSVALFGAYLFWRDVRREVRLAEMRSQFVSSVSHDLKTPLTAIRMFAETLLLGRSADSQTRDEYLETIVNESERLTRLLNNVLDFSKIEQGKKTYRLEPHSLASIVRAAAKAMHYPLSQQGFELRVEIDDDLAMVASDPDAIEQAILNLLSNAMKYSGQARLIDLQLKKDGDHAVIAVTDRGLGIAASQQTKIFEKFYRVSSADTQLIPGTGLGLALVDHVARAHGGRVAVRSVPGEGSAFSIVLPLLSASAGDVTRAEAKETSLRGLV